jgi:hypothetical protein
MIFGAADLNIFVELPSADWNEVGSYSVSLDASSGWRLFDAIDSAYPGGLRFFVAAGDIATAEQITAALANVNELRLEQIPPGVQAYDGGFIDNVFLVPEPATGALLVAAVALLWSLRR